jgi:molybdopterin molybdotransferase
LRATLEAAHDGVLDARLTGRQGSNLATSMARAQALLEIEGPVTELPTGTMVRAVLLDGALFTEPDSHTLSQ